MGPWKTEGQNTVDRRYTDRQSFPHNPWDYRKQSFSSSQNLSLLYFHLITFLVVAKLHVKKMQHSVEKVKQTKRLQVLLRGDATHKKIWDADAEEIKTSSDRFLCLIWGVWQYARFSKQSLCILAFVTPCWNYVHQYNVQYLTHMRP